MAQQHPVRALLLLLLVVLCMLCYADASRPGPCRALQGLSRHNQLAVEEARPALQLQASSERAAPPASPALSRSSATAPKKSIKSASLIGILVGALVGFIALVTIMACGVVHLCIRITGEGRAPASTAGAISEDPAAMPLPDVSIIIGHAVSMPDGSLVGAIEDSSSCSSEDSSASSTDSEEPPSALDRCSSGGGCGSGGGDGGGISTCSSDCGEFRECCRPRSQCTDDLSSECGGSGSDV